MVEKQASTDYADPLNRHPATALRNAALRQIMDMTPMPAAIAEKSL